MALIGGLASKFLPSAIGWGLKKLANTEIGYNMANKLDSLRKKVNTKDVRKILQMITQKNPRWDPNDDRKYKKIKKKKQVKFK